MRRNKALHIFIALSVVCILVYCTVTLKIMSGEKVSHNKFSTDIKEILLDATHLHESQSSNSTDISIKTIVNQRLEVAVAKPHLRKENTEDLLDRELSYNVHVFYYPWYASKSYNGEWSHWNHKTIPHWTDAINRKYPQMQHMPPDDIGAHYYPQLGPYSSNNPDIIDAHMRQLRKAGVGVLAVSWYPPHTKDSNAIIFVDNFMKLIMDIAGKYREKVCFHIEPYENRTALTVRKDIDYIIKTYGNHKSFYRYEGRPLIYIYDSYLIPSDEWASVFTVNGRYTIRGTVLDVVAIGLFVERNHCRMLTDAGFNGFYTYFAAQKFVYSSTLSNWKDLKSCANHMPSPSLFIPSVGPGYDDSPVRPWNRENTRERCNGFYYREMWDAALQTDPEIISITSFNEWHEGSQIESAVKKTGYADYGEDPEMYLKLTKELVKRMKRM